MVTVSEIIANLRRYVPSIEVGDILEILIIAFLLYHIMLWIQKTRAWTLLKGLLVILFFWVVASYFKMNTILWLGQNVFGFAVTAMIVVLQPELRKALEELGNKNLIANALPFLSSISSDARRSIQSDLPPIYSSLSILSVKYLTFILSILT